MYETSNVKRNNVQKQKKIYLFLGILLMIGIILGISYVFVLNEVDGVLLTDEITRFFTQMKSIEHFSYGSSFLNSILSNVLYVFTVWLLGISIIGLPIILFLLMMKGFIFGFSISSIIKVYHLKGILGSISYIFPHQLLFLIISLLLVYYATSFSTKLFSYLFLKKNIKLKEVMHKYIRILLIGILGSLVASCFEVFLSPFLIQLFTKMI